MHQDFFLFKNPEMPAVEKDWTQRHAILLGDKPDKGLRLCVKI